MWGWCWHAQRRFAAGHQPGLRYQDHEADFAEAIFHPEFLESIARFSTLRFMDMMRTNGSTQSEWADRPLTSDALQGPVRVIALVQDDFDYPKYRAAMDFITDNPVWW